MLIATAVASLAAFGIGELLTGLFGVMPSILISSIFFTVFALLLCVAIFACEYIFQGFGIVGFRDRFSNKSVRGNTLKVVAILLVGVFAASALFQFLYELEPSGKSSKATNYAFVIDNSGSMTVSDPDNYRFTALQDIAVSLPADAPVAVYIFGTTTECVRPFQTQENVPFIADETWYVDQGGTNLYTALRKCSDDIEKAQDDGLISGKTRIIVLSDGACAELSSFFHGSKRKDIIKKVSKADGEIFTIGFGEPDVRMMTEIAEGTGGVYYDANSSYDLVGAISSAVKANSAGRLLMGVRSGRTAYHFGYALMRIVFVALLGAAFSIASGLLMGHKPIEKLIFIQCGAKSIAAGILIEVLTQNVSGDTVHRLITCLVIGTLVLFIAAGTSYTGFSSGSSGTGTGTGGGYSFNPNDTGLNRNNNSYIPDNDSLGKNNDYRNNAPQSNLSARR